MSEYCIIALGMFDGVHLGHQALLKSAVKRKEKTGLPIKVVTFQIHPKQLLGQPPQLLCNNEEKSSLCKQYGADEVLFLPFDEQMRKMPPEQFVEKYLINELNAKYIIVGENYRFGYCQNGTSETLKKYDEFDTEVIPSVCFDDEIICSSKIRAFLLAGELERALKYLGHDLNVCGNVESGRKMGKTLGFPTANLKTFFPPLANGVYITETKIKNRWHPSVSNFGTIPTFLKDDTQVLETHFLDYNESIYGEKITVRFLKFVRNEMKFSCKEQLIEQIKKDKQSAMDYFSCL